ncbi:MAG: tripartite tricarboxylate transporter TctB family protein [Elusimicrobiota bacterium]|nr:tripartite tricarboxylate transporter TctB family protein [Elusimicrobiota bacterium]
MGSKNRDFLIALALLLIGVYVAFEGYRIYLGAAQPPFSITRFSISPGFLPTILGVVLTVLSLLLLKNAVSSSNGLKNGFKERKNEIVFWAKGAFKNADIVNMAIGIFFMGIYVFILMQLLPFWAASFIFLAVIFWFLKIGKLWKVLLIAAIAVCATVIFFQGLFNTPLP